MKLAQDAHSRAEQQVYEALWENGKPLDDVSRAITVGFGTLARLARLSESNARINTRNLIAKLAIEELRSHDCERSTGRTYRVFSYAEILRRRQDAGLTWYQRRTLAVIFVDSVSGQPIPLSKSVPGIKLDPGLNLIPDRKIGPHAGRNLGPDPAINLDENPGPNLRPPYREVSRENNIRESSTTNVAAIVQALRDELGQADDEAAGRILTACRQRAPEATVEEIAEFVRRDARRLRTNRRIDNPVGALIRQVPKRFEGESWRLHRERQQGREFTDQDQEAEMAHFREEQRARLSDPNLSEEEKQIIRKWI